MTFRTLFLFLFVQMSFSSFADTVDNDTSRAVWANEAIVATYTYNYQNFIARQREIATYFTSDAWIAYSKALTASKLPDSIQKNAYYVGAVATSPPQVKLLRPNHWQATMPILVVYKNPQYEQKQTLSVTLQFTTAPPGQGVRGYAILNLQTKNMTPPCKCVIPEPQVMSIIGK